MSLGVAIKGPEGIVLAADSRVTLEARPVENNAPFPVNYDNATKLLSFSKPHNYIGAVTYGLAILGLRTAHSYVPEFEVWLAAKHNGARDASNDEGNRLPVEKFAGYLGEFYLMQWEKAGPKDSSAPSMVFIVGGFDPGAAYGRIFLVDIPRNPTPVEQNPGDENFGMTWGGQLGIASRLIHGYDPVLSQILLKELDITEKQVRAVTDAIRRHAEFRIPYMVLPLQDCVDLAAFMVRTTIEAQNLGVGVRGVGGPIDVAVITRNKGLEHIQQKEIRVRHGDG